MISSTVRRALTLFAVTMAAGFVATGCNDAGSEAVEGGPSSSTAVEAPAEIEPVGELVLRPVLGTGGTPDGVDLLSDADGLVYRLGPVPGGPALVESAEVVEYQPGTWAVALVLSDGEQGIGRLNRLASICVGGPDPRCPANSLGSNQSGAVAMVIGDEVISAPEINAVSFERDQVIVSARDEASARSIAAQLSAGSTATSVPR